MSDEYKELGEVPLEPGMEEEENGGYSKMDLPAGLLGGMPITQEMIFSKANEMMDQMLDIKELMFDDVNKGDMPTQEIHLQNPTSENVTPVLLHLPEYLKADVSPSSIPPGKTGVITLTLDSRKIADYGLSQATIYLGQSPSDKVSPEKEIHVEAILIPSTGDITEQRLAYMPRMRISSTVLDLGEFEGKKKKKGTIVIENLGRTDLEITSLQMFTDGITVELSDAVIQPGTSARLRVVADLKAMKGVTRQPRILMITNDPRAPKVVIDVNIK